MNPAEAIDLAVFALNSATQPEGSTSQDLARLSRDGNAAAAVLLKLRNQPQVRRCALCGYAVEYLRPVFIIDDHTGDTIEDSQLGACNHCANVIYPHSARTAHRQGWTGVPDD